MTVETATYISDLNATYPTSTDSKSEGDNHLRLIKAAIKATFPNVTGPVTKTQAQLNATSSGDVVGPASTTDNTIVRYDGTTGKLIQSSSATLDDSAGLAGITSVNGGQLAGLRNRIINGKMEIAQRGTSFAAASGYTLDRWQFDASTAAVLTASQQADFPLSNYEFQSSLRLAVTTADTSISSGEFARIQHKIEGYNARDLIGKTFTLSFWVRSAKTGVHCVGMRNSGADRSYVGEYTVNSALAWEQKSITVTGGLPSTGTWDWTNGVGLGLNFMLAAGTSFHTTAGSWQTGSFIATANQVNCLDTIGNIFAITGVQLEVGSVATPFEHRPYGMELALCRRYLPGLSDGAGAGSAGAVCPAVWGSTTSADAFVLFDVPPRTNPTGVTVSSAGHFLVNNPGVGNPVATAITFTDSSLLAARVTCTVASGGGAAGTGSFIRLNSSSAKLLFTGCEL